MQTVLKMQTEGESETIGGLHEAGFGGPNAYTGMNEEEMAEAWGEEPPPRLYDPAGAARRAEPMMNLPREEEGTQAGAQTGPGAEEQPPGPGLPFNEEALQLLRAATEIQAAGREQEGEPPRPQSPRGHHVRKDPPHRAELE